MEFINTIRTKASSFQMPDLDFAVIAKHVDGFCSIHVNNVVDFLDRHPGISMALSPETVLRRCAQKHADKQIGYGVSESKDVPSA